MPRTRGLGPWKSFVRDCRGPPGTQSSTPARAVFLPHRNGRRGCACFCVSDWIYDLMQTSAATTSTAFCSNMHKLRALVAHSPHKLDTLLHVPNARVPIAISLCFHSLAVSSPASTGSRLPTIRRHSSAPHATPLRPSHRIIPSARFSYAGGATAPPHPLSVQTLRFKVAFASFPMHHPSTRSTVCQQLPPFPLPQLSPMHFLCMFCPDHSTPPTTATPA